MAPGLNLLKLNEQPRHIVEEKLPVDFLFQILYPGLFSQLRLRSAHRVDYCGKGILAQIVHEFQKVCRLLDPGQEVELITGAHYRKGSGEQGEIFTGYFADLAYGLIWHRSHYSAATTKSDKASRTLDVGCGIYGEATLPIIHFTSHISYPTSSTRIW